MIGDDEASFAAVSKVFHNDIKKQHTMIDDSCPFQGTSIKILISSENQMRNISE